MRFARLIESLGYYESRRLPGRNAPFSPLAKVTPPASSVNMRSTTSPSSCMIESAKGLPLHTTDITDPYSRRIRCGLTTLSLAGRIDAALALACRRVMALIALRLLQLHDLAFVAAECPRPTGMSSSKRPAGIAPWWALPPLQFDGAYYGAGASDRGSVRALESQCPWHFAPGHPGGERCRMSRSRIFGWTRFRASNGLDQFATC